VAIAADYRDLHQAFAHGPAVLREAIHSLTMSELTRRGPGAGWSVRDVLVHLADMEIVRAYRIRLILAAEEPDLADIDEEGWQRKLQYLWRSPEAALSGFEQARFGTAEILNHVGRDAWKRTGTHPVDGPVSVADLVQRGVRHVEDHVGQIAEIRAPR